MAAERDREREAYVERIAESIMWRARGDAQPGVDWPGDLHDAKRIVEAVLQEQRDAVAGGEADPAGLTAARRYAGWEYGDAGMADSVLRAYFDPAGTNEQLDADSAPERTGL